MQRAIYILIGIILCGIISAQGIKPKYLENQDRYDILVGDTAGRILGTPIDTLISFDSLTTQNAIKVTRRGPDTIREMVYKFVGSGVLTNIVQGPTGDTGPTGPQGPQGAQGDTGDTGAQGIQGIQGIQGLPGDWYQTTSTTSLTLAKGTQNLTVDDSLDYSIGQGVVISNTSTKLMTGTVTAYNDANGAMSAEIDTFIGSGTYTSWSVNISGLRGVKGPMGATGSTGSQGPQGAQGDPGTDGNTILNGTAVPTTEGVNGDFYIDTDDNDIYGPKSGTWGSATSLVGPQGAQGDKGDTGDTGAAGADGADGDIYATTSTDNESIGTGTKNITVETGLAWTPGQRVIMAYDASNTMGGEVTTYTTGTGAMVIEVDETEGSGTYASWTVNLGGVQGPTGDTGPTGPQGPAGSNGSNGADGADGADGNTVLNGTSAPTTQGVTGDFYINTTTYDIYGPKSGTWGGSTSLVGPTGAQGPAGDPATDDQGINATQNGSHVDIDLDGTSDDLSLRAGANISYTVAEDASGNTDYITIQNVPTVNDKANGFDPSVNGSNQIEIDPDFAEATDILGSTVVNSDKLLLLDVSAGTYHDVTIATILSEQADFDLSTSNEIWTIDGDDADTEVISTQTVKFEGAGNITTDWDGANDKLIITGTDSDTQLTDEEVQDKAGAMVAGNTETLITVTYQDLDGTIDYVVDNDLSLYDNSTSNFSTGEHTTNTDGIYDGSGDMSGTETVAKFTDLQWLRLEGDNGGGDDRIYIRPSTPNIDLRNGSNKMVLQPFAASGVSLSYTLASSSEGFVIEHGNTDRIVVSYGGDVGIGRNATTNKLEVAGSVSVHSGSFIDDGTTLTVPDYVFTEEYNRLSIDDIDTHIKEKGHLPNVPSATDTEGWANISLQNRDMKMLEKIEELTLFIIDQQKQIDALEKRIEQLEAKFKPNGKTKDKNFKNKN